MELVIAVTLSGVFGIIALDLILEHIEITGKKPWDD